MTNGKIAGAGCLIALVLLGSVGDAEARRSGRSSSSSHSTSGKSSSHDSGDGHGSSSIKIELPGGSGPSDPATGAAGDTAFTGERPKPRAGSGPASSAGAAATPLSAEDIRKYEERQAEGIRKAREADERKAAEKAAMAEERRRLADKAREDEARRQRDAAQRLTLAKKAKAEEERKGRCVFKPVMTDAERDLCNEVWR